MRDGYWSASRRPRQRVALIVTPLVITMSVGLIIGIRLHERTPSLTLSSQGAGRKSAPPVASGAPNTNCELIVPARPLTARGLATPYQLTGISGQSPRASECMENNASLSAFVQATILDPATGMLSVYEPLVVTQGTKPAVAPVVPALPPGAVVTLDFGFNGADLTLAGATSSTLSQAACVNGVPGSAFSEVAFCNGTAFYSAVGEDIAAGRTVIPANTGSPVTGRACPTTRSFTLADQDQSDNVTTQYLVTGNGGTAQDSPRNVAALKNATAISNGGGNTLLNSFLDPAIGCKPFTAPDLSQAGAPGTSQALDELFAASNQQAPVALVPENDPMTLVNGAFSVTKTNAYRAGVGQPAIASSQASDTPAAYCANLVDTQTPFLADNQTSLAHGTSPSAAVGSNLLTFMAARLRMSFSSLNCAAFGLTDPVTVTISGGAATSATFSTTPQLANTPTGTSAVSNPAAAGQPNGGIAQSGGWVAQPMSPLSGHR